VEDNKYKWFLCGGFILGVCWLLAGILWCMTIVGFDIGKKCFKISATMFYPYGKDIVFLEKRKFELIDMAWLLLSGIWLMFISIILGIILCMSIVGFRYGVHCFKMVTLAVMPLDIDICREDE